MGDGIHRVRGALCTAIFAALSLNHASAMTLQVDDASDSAAATGCTFRGALAAINSQTMQSGDPCSTAATGTLGQNDTIQFTPALVNSVITLQQGQLKASNPVDIQGSGQTIDAGGKSPALSIYCRYPAYTTCVFHVANVKLTNAASVYGNAALAVTYHATAQLDNITVSNNTGYNALSAGMNIAGSTVTMNNCTVTQNTDIATNNYALYSGAGMLVEGATLLMTNSTVSGNRFLATGQLKDLGGGIAAIGSTLRIVDSTVALNSVDSDGPFVGGGIMADRSKVYLSNLTVAQNVGKGTDHTAGGAAFFAHNVSGFPVDVRNATVTGNTVTTPGSGASGVLFSTGYATAPVLAAVLANSIVSRNTGATDVAFDAGITAADITAQSDLFGTATQANLTGTNVVFSDSPGLSGLADNGGATQTMALLAGSPAVGAGDPALASFLGVPLTFDQRGAGFARTLSGAVDIGAFQTQGDRIMASAFELAP